MLIGPGSPPAISPSSAVARSNRAHVEHRIDTALEAVRRVRLEPERASAPRDRRRREVRGLEEDRLRVCRHRGGEATHDAGERNGRALVGDDEHLGRQLDFASVEQHELLSRARVAHDDGALQLVEVEGMHRLAQLEHDVVGHVDDGLQRADPGTPQALAHPERRDRIAAQPAHDASRIGGA
jgi:hypothetical protein